MSDHAFRDQLLELFSQNPKSAYEPSDVATALELRGKQIKKLRGVLYKMVIGGDIVELRKGVFGLGKAADLVTGKLTVLRGGRGVVNPPGGEDPVWVESGDQATALPHDIVMVRLYPRRGSDRVTGKVVRIVERSVRDIVGTLITTGRFLCVVPLNPAYAQDLYVPDAGGAKPNDRVVVRFTGWANRHVSPEGEIIEVLGPADNPSLDTKVVMRQHDLPEEFPQEVMSEAEEVATFLEKPGEREDLRDTFVLTIDPETARDFDDAISIETDDQGRRVLGVHIADVSHFVRPASKLDEEARKRGTSVYLVDQVVPMLPEQLSNGVCSLVPDKDRLTFSAFLIFDERTQVVASRFARTRICSRLRLSYEEALAVLEGRAPESGKAIPGEAVPLIKATHEIAVALRKARFKRFALDLEIPESQIIMGEDGMMTGVESRHNDIAHQMIEECMVAANEAVATEMANRGTKILSRLHEPPDEEKLEALAADLAQLGFKPGDLTVPKNLAHFVSSLVDDPLKYHAGMLVLRSMKRAEYSADKSGHFGLAKQHYAHFTSPIRRYPDLVLHRQLALALAGKQNGRLDLKYLRLVAQSSTESEQVADDASRALIEVKKFRFLQQQIDDGKPLDYDAVVVKITNFGMFVEVPDLMVMGLVHISTISKQFVSHDDATQTLSVSGTTYKVGLDLRVRVASVNFDQRRVDFALCT